MRRADAATSPAAAKKLRDLASNLRRAERKAAKKSKPSKLNKAEELRSSGANFEVKVIDRTASPAWQNAIAAAETPGRGNMAGGTAGNFAQTAMRAAENLANAINRGEEPLWSVDPGQDTSDELTIGNRGDARMVELQKIAQGLEAELRRHDEVAIAEFIESVALKKAYITPSPTANFLCIPLSQINAILRALQKK